MGRSCWILFVLTLCLSQPARTSPTLPTSKLKIFENLAAAPAGWEVDKRADPSDRLSFHISLHQPRAVEFEQRVIDISNPSHPHYGRHLQQHEISAMLQPDDDASKAVSSWLAAYGVHSQLQNNWITFDSTVEKAEKILNTEFYRFKGEDNTTIVRALKYSVPSSLHGIVDLIQPTTRFPQTKPQLVWSTKEDRVIAVPQPQDDNFKSCNFTITPDCLRELYRLGNFTADTKNGNKLGISGYLEQYAQYSDLSLFMHELAPYASADNFTFASINQGLNTQSPDADSMEANLDIQYGLALTANTPVTYYSTAGRGELVPDLDQPNASVNSNEPYLDQLHYLLGLSDEELPTVLSTSYGENEQSVPPSYAKAVCSLFAQLGARGVSVIFASGDTGVGQNCRTNDGDSTPRFQPIFPATCPFVTSVGGTYGISPEKAAFFSSGGFSDLFLRPAYQEDDVKEYLDGIGDRWKDLFNPEGRGFPDVAAQSAYFTIFNDGHETLLSGTSASAPVFAAIISNLNSIRMSAGFPSLGFLNPWLYSEGFKGLTDIVDGSSMGCQGIHVSVGDETPHPLNAYWNATLGWDPVTGLGTPDFLKLLGLMPRANITGSGYGDTIA